MKPDFRFLIPQFVYSASSMKLGLKLFLFKVLTRNGKSEENKKSGFISSFGRFEGLQNYIFAEYEQSLTSILLNLMENQ